jgi:hypothetical protein
METKSAFIVDGVKEMMDFTPKLNSYFEAYVEIPRIKHGKKQTLDTLISEEALLLAKFLRNERTDWNPRIPTIYIAR